MERHPFDITVIGAGVVGLAIAEELSRHFSGILLLEKTRAMDRKRAAATAKSSMPGSTTPRGL
jgi:glycine/D-amino acid oxidase-like deaminating enzyme